MLNVYNSMEFFVYFRTRNLVVHNGRFNILHCN